MEARIGTYPCDECNVPLFHCQGCEMREAMTNAVYNPERLKEARSEMSKIVHAYRRAKANNSRRLEN